MRLTRQQVREVDRRAIEDYGIPGIVLMENAGINASAAVLDVIIDELGLHPMEGTVSIVCGGGNNGGDGYVMARHLHIWGVAVEVFAIKPIEKLTGDASINAMICRQLGLPIHDVSGREGLETAMRHWQSGDVIVDALLGTGFEGRVRDWEATVIESINTCERPVVVAVDVPSGLDCDTGRPSNATVRAAITVTFVATKVGFDHESATQWTGVVREADIGIPFSLAESVIAETTE